AWSGRSSPAPSAASTFRCWRSGHRRTSAGSSAPTATGTSGTSGCSALLVLEFARIVVDHSLGGSVIGPSDISLRMRTAAGFESDHAAVEGRPGVGADTELLAQRTGDRHEVAAAAAVRRGPGGEFALPAGFRMLPAAGGRGQSVGREHTLTAETEFEVRDLVDVVRRVVLGLLEARLQVRVLVELGQGVPRSHVPGLETLLPGHPFGCDEGVGARQQSRLADRDLLRAR